MNSINHLPKHAVAPACTSSRPPRLLDLLRERIRYKHYSLRTEQAYVHWVRAFIRQQGMRHPREMGTAEVDQFPCWLANEGNVAPATHNQPLFALLFLYREVLAIDLPWMDGQHRAHEEARARAGRLVAHRSRATARGWLRHPHGAGTVRARRRVHHDDLHPRAQQGWARRGFADRRAVTCLRQRRQAWRHSQIFQRKGARGSGW